jgi:hypothetical protein
VLEVVVMANPGIGMKSTQFGSSWIQSINALFRRSLVESKELPNKLASIIESAPGGKVRVRWRGRLQVRWRSCRGEMEIKNMPLTITCSNSGIVNNDIVFMIIDVCFAVACNLLRRIYVYR